MNRLFLMFLVILFSINCNQAASEESITFGRFGKMTVYRSAAQPSQVVLFVSGDGGWNLGVIDMAKALSSLGALVVGIDITHYMKELAKSTEKCLYPAADFELLSKFVQKKYDYANYRTPILFGYSSGATLVYATLVQAPPETFKGAISMGFCPDLPLIHPLCRGNGLEWEPGPKGKGYSFLPVATLEVPWVVLQGTIDQVCDAATVEKYVTRVKCGELILLPKVGHGFSVEKNWLPQFKQAFSRVVETKDSDLIPQSDDLKDIPLIEVPSKESSTQYLSVVVTGDGGWGVTDRGIAQTLAAQGIPAVGLNSLHYFWRRRTPEESAKDLARILNHYLNLWKKDKVILVGYSMGADVLPFMINRLPAGLFDKIRQIVLLGPSKLVDFEFHLSDWLGGVSRKTSLPILPEIQKLKGKKIICFYGEDDTETICKELSQDYVTIVPQKGGHRIGDRYKVIVDTMMKEL